jgi:hypothetical protein
MAYQNSAPITNICPETFTSAEYFTMLRGAALDELGAQNLYQNMIEAALFLGFLDDADKLKENLQEETEHLGNLIKIMETRIPQFKQSYGAGLKGA